MAELKAFQLATSRLSTETAIRWGPNASLPTLTDATSSSRVESRTILVLRLAGTGHGQAIQDHGLRTRALYRQGLHRQGAGSGPDITTQPGQALLQVDIVHSKVQLRPGQRQCRPHQHQISLLTQTAHTDAGQATAAAQGLARYRVVDRHCRRFQHQGGRAPNPGFQGQAGLFTTKPVGALRLPAGVRAEIHQAAGHPVGHLHPEAYPVTVAPGRVGNGQGASGFGGQHTTLILLGFQVHKRLGSVYFQGSPEPLLLGHIAHAPGREAGSGQNHSAGNQPLVEFQNQSPVIWVVIVVSGLRPACWSGAPTAPAGTQRALRPRPAGSGYSCHRAATPRPGSYPPGRYPGLPATGPPVPALPPGMRFLPGAAGCAPCRQHWNSKLPDGHYYRSNTPGYAPGTGQSPNAPGCYPTAPALPAAGSRCPG